MKRLTVSRLKEYFKDQKEIKFIKYEIKDNIAKRSLESFTGSASYFLFHCLKLDTSFKKKLEQWETLKYFQEARGCVERVVLATTFNKSLTKIEEEKLLIFQFVKDHRKPFPEERKKLLRSGLKLLQKV